jgi:hypothetical protein
MHAPDGGFSRFFLFLLMAAEKRDMATTLLSFGF